MSLSVASAVLAMVYVLTIVVSFFAWKRPLTRVALGLALLMVATYVARAVTAGGVKHWSFAVLWVGIAGCDVLILRMTRLTGGAS